MTHIRFQTQVAGQLRAESVKKTALGYCHSAAVTGDPAATLDRVLRGPKFDFRVSVS